jgi:adenosylmethionine-8-amino-7-oxononanoate aminotransferase
MRLVTRGDLDGLTCAVIITSCETIDEIMLVHPQDITDQRLAITSDDVLANLPYHPGCGKWFDHHLLTESNERPPAVFEGRYGLAPSAARVTFEYYLPAHPEIRKHQVLLIADEVATGFGRTGTMFACEQEQVTPDLLCVAKGLTGGYLPLAATLSTDDVYEAFLGERAEQKTFYHGHSYTGNALGCAAALASLDLFASENVIARVAERAAQLGELLTEKIAPLPAVREIRQKGLMIGIELGAAGKPVPPTEGRGMKVCMAIRKHGVILRPLGDVIVLMPPLCVTEEEVHLLASATAKAIVESA